MKFLEIFAQSCIYTIIGFTVIEIAHETLHALDFYTNTIDILLLIAINANAFAKLNQDK